jgi:hypothetical protein
MRGAIILVSVLGVVTMGAVVPGRARAANVSVGVQTSNLNLGINIDNTPPPLVAVPGPVVVAPAGPHVPPPPAVYIAPNVPYNYFVYQQAHYVYHEGRWFRARHHNGPWMVIAISQVPRPVLAVPVEHYKVRPAHWKHHGPPPWAEAKGYDKERGHDKEKGHGKKTGKGHDD